MFSSDPRGSWRVGLAEISGEMRKASDFLSDSVGAESFSFGLDREEGCAEKGSKDGFVY
jgi:hypothetical protein